MHVDGVSAAADNLSLFGQRGLFGQVHASECSSSRPFATTVPLAFCHGPLPIRSRAFTPASPPGGANLGGLEGADAHCQALAKAAGSTKTNWKAYLSTTASPLPALVTKNDIVTARHSSVRGLFADAICAMYCGRTYGLR